MRSRHQTLIKIFCGKKLYLPLLLD